MRRGRCPTADTPGVVAYHRELPNGGARGGTGSVRENGSPFRKAANQYGFAGTAMEPPSGFRHGHHATFRPLVYTGNTRG